MEKKYIVILMLTIMVLGIITIYSASYVYAYRNNSVSTNTFINNHMIYIIIGIVLMLTAEMIDYRVYKNYLTVIGVFLAIMLLLTKVYGVLNGYKAARWIKIGGFSLQITEFVKIYIIYYIANYIKSNRLKISKFNTGVLTPLFKISPILILIFIEPDLGTTIIMFLISVTLLFMAGAKIRHILAVVLVLLLVIAALSVSLFPYQWNRLLHSHTNQQVLNGERGIGSGGIIGKGLGKGSEKYTMTQSFTDFIFVTFGEEWGLVGLFLLLLSYWAIFYYIIDNVKFVKDEFGRFYLSGFALYLFAQVLINISGVLAITPLKGLTVPLLSYGGSSTVATLFGFGIVLNIIKNYSKAEKR